MIDQNRAFRAVESARRKLDVKVPGGVNRLVSLSPYLLVCFFVMPGAASAQPAPKKYAQTYVEPFKGPPQKAEDFALLGADADKCVKFEPAGLRITLPAGYPKERPGTGVVTRFGVAGDFEITLKYEILQEPEPNNAGPQTTRFTLGILLVKPSTRAALNLRWGAAGKQLQTWTARPEPEPKPGKPREESHMFPAKAKTGRLRLARSGAELSYFAAEGADADFQLLQTHTFSVEDLKYLNIAAVTGGPKAALDVRVADLRIRSDAVPGTPADDAPAEPQPAQPPASPPREGDRGWLVAGVLVGLAIALLGVLALGAVLFLRKRGGPAGAAPTAGSIACPKCARVLKTTAEMVGKKAKCARCGTVVLVPPAKSEA